MGGYPEFMHCTACRVGWRVEVPVIADWTAWRASSPDSRCWSCGEIGAFGNVFSHCAGE